MSIEIDWSKTSMSAIGAMVANFNHPKGYGHIEFIYSPADRNKYREGPASWEYRHAPVEAPVEPWTGEGLPPVGTVCEIRTQGMPRYNEAEIRYISPTILVWKWHGDLISPEQVEYAINPELIEFRPLRTAEQIAAEERLAGIAEIQRIVEAGFSSGSSSSASLWDAGYRKQEAAQ